MLQENIESSNWSMVNLSAMNSLQKHQTAELIWLASQKFYNLFSLTYEKTIEIIKSLIEMENSDLSLTVGLCWEDEIIGVHVGFPIHELYDRQMVSVLTFLKSISYEEKNLALLALKEHTKQVPKIQVESYYLCRFAVLQRFRGRKVAQLLFNDFVQKANAYPMISLHVKTDNSRAINFYQKNQFNLWQSPEFQFGIMMRQKLDV